MILPTLEKELQKVTHCSSDSCSYTKGICIFNLSELLLLILDSHLDWNTSYKRLSSASITRLHIAEDRANKHKSVCNQPWHLKWKMTPVVEWLRIKIICVGRAAIHWSGILARWKRSSFLCKEADSGSKNVGLIWKTVNEGCAKIL